MTGLRRWHKILGLVMVLPFLAWSVTGAIFFVKPGYGEAYSYLPIKTYPLAGSLNLEFPPDWFECRLVKTVLGDHLLVNTPDGSRHFHLDLTPWPQPDQSALRRLFEDAITANPSRYGKLTEVKGSGARTDTGISLSLNWDTLSLSQRGKDTDRIDKFYDIHYLRWTGVTWLDRIIGMVGLALIPALALTGTVLFFKTRTRS